MSLEASSLTIVVNSTGIADATKALNDLATAGEKAEKNTSNIGSGAQASAKVQVDAAQQAVQGFNALTSSVRNATSAQDEAAKMAAKIREQMEKIDMMSQVQRWKDAAAAAREEAAALRQAQTAANSINRDVDAFVATLKRQADTIGMTTKEIRDYNAEQLRSRAAQLGVSDQVDGYINKLKSAKGAHEGLSLATAGTSRELLVLTHELATGQLNRFYGSLLVLGERVNVMPAIWKALGSAASALGVSFGVLLGAIVAVGVALAAGIMTYMHSASALKDLNKEVILTGNSAGATGDALYTMANRIGSAYGEFGKAREAVIAVASTGKFTADQINLIAEAAVGMEKYAGVSIEKTAAAFEKLAGNPLKITDKGFKDVSNAAMQLDEQMHFLEPTVLAHIMQLERQGEHAAASRVAIAALAGEEKKRAEELKSQLTSLGSLLDTMGQKASNFWNNLLHKGSLTDQLKETQDHLARLESFGKGDNDFGVREDKAKIKELQNAILQGEYDAADKAHNKTMDRLANEQQVYLRNLMERSKGEENLQQRLARFDNVIAQQREKARNDPAYAAMMQGVLSDASVEMMRKQVERDSIKAAPKPHTEGMSGLDKTVNEINERYEVQKRAMDNEIKLIDFKNKYGLMEDEDAQAQKEKLLDDELQLEKDHLQKALDAIDAFHTNDIRLANDAASKRANIQKQLNKVMSDIDVKSKMNDLVPDVNYAAEQAKQQKEQDNILKQIERQTKSVQAQVDAYTNLPDAVKAVGVRQKEMASEVEQAKIDTLQAERDSLQSNDLIEQAMNGRRVAQIDKEIAARQKLKAVDVAKEANDKQNNDALNRSSALTKIATEQVKMWKDAGNEIEKSLKAAFGNSGKAAGEMFKVFAESQSQQIDLANQIRIVKEKDGLTDEERTRQITALQDSSAQSTIAMYGSIADAASGFFDKQSQGYKIATSISKAFHLAETAMALASIPAKLAAGAATMFAQSGWGGFAGVAAMTAAVAAFGVAVTGGGGGPISSEEQQRRQGTGTVLGAPTILDGVDVKLVGQKSDSIANSLKITEKNSGLGLVVQNDMLDALRKLDNSINSFAILAVQNSGLTGYTANNSKSFDNKTVNGLGAVGGALGGASLAAYAAIGMSFAFPVLGTIAGALIGAMVGHGIVGKALSSVFGGSKSVDDTGLTIGKTSLGQVETSGLTGQQYTNTTTSGGWFRSDSHDTSTQTLGTEFNNQITQVVLSMEDTLKTAAVGLGIGGDEFDKKLQSFVVDIGNISLKGMTGDEIQKTLQNVFSKLGDQMAQFAFSDLQKYQKIGEGLMETVVRVANDLQQVKDVFDSLSKTIPKAVDAISTSEALIEQFGSVDNLTKGVKSYINAIYTDQEKLMPIIKSVSTAMDGLGLSYVKTKEQFKQVVDSLDLTTEAGAKMFATLMNIAPAFAQTIDDTEKLANDARSALTDAYKRESDAIKETQDKMKSLVTTLKQLSSSSMLGDLSPLTPQQKYLEAKSQFETVAEKAQNGDKDAQDQFEASYTAFLEASKVANASGAQYQKDFVYAQKVTQQATEWAQKQVNVAQATLDALNKQVEGLIDVNDSLLTVSQAIANLITALKGTPKGDQVANQAASNAQSAIEKLYNDILHRASDAAGMQFWLDKISQGVSLTDIANAIANSPEAKGEIKPIGSTGSTQAITPVTATVSTGTQSVVHADVVAAINDLKATVAESNQATTNTLVGAVYDSQDNAANKIVSGTTTAITSTKVGTSYKIVER
jgi:phage-related minor tail protein